jgi:hypothetical protein
MAPFLAAIILRRQLVAAAAQSAPEPDPSRAVVTSSDEPDPDRAIVTAN